MDEDETLYREMNEEDPYYMGDISTHDPQRTQTNPKPYKKDTANKHTNKARICNSGKGCITCLIGLVIIILIVILLIW